MLLRSLLTRHLCWNCEAHRAQRGAYGALSGQNDSLSESTLGALQAYHSPLSRKCLHLLHKFKISKD